MKNILNMNLKIILYVGYKFLVDIEISWYFFWNKKKIYKLVDC